MKEKRKCPRFPVMLPTVFFGERAGGGLVVDVSLEGCRIRSPVPLLDPLLQGEALGKDELSTHYAHQRKRGLQIFLTGAESRLELV